MARIRFAALGAAFFIASAAAGAQAPQRDRASSESRGARGDRGEGRGQKGLFKDIALSEQQKSQIKTIHAKYRDQYQSQRGNRQKGDSAWGQRRNGGERAQRDTAAMRQRREAMQAQIAHNSQLRQQEMAEIRGVLTVDQRVTFDRNVAELKTRIQERASKGEGRGHGKKRGQKFGR